MSDDDKTSSADQSASSEPIQDLYDRWSEGWIIPTDVLLDRAEELSPRQLIEVLLADQQERWEDGEPVAVEDYLLRFPAVAEDTEGAVDLIYGDYLLAADSGQADRATYLNRFTQFRHELEMQFELDAGLSDNDDSRSSASRKGDDFGVKPGQSGLAANSSSDQDRVPSQFGRYEVTRKIGEGGMGEVYEARDPAVARRVAIKIPKTALLEAASEKTVDSFAKEVRTAGNVQHPNVCEIYDVGEQDDVPFVVMQFVDGEPLDTWLKLRHGKVEQIEFAVDLIFQVADGLAEAHRQGIIHRDIKPGNILIGRDGRPRLSDFGLASLETDRVQSEVQQRVPGTWKYMAPEAQLGRAELVGPWSDVYSLGLVLWQMISGEVPGGLTTTVVDDSSASKLVDSAEEANIDATLLGILQRAIDPVAEQRYRSAEEFARDLRRWLQNTARLSEDAVEDPAIDWHNATTDYPDSEQLPRVLSLLWMLLMQPISLHQRLKRCGIDKPEQAAWRMWRDPGRSRSVRRDYLRRMAAILFFITPLIIFLVSNVAAILLQLFSATAVEGRGVIATAILATTGIVFSMIFAAFRGPAWGVSWGLSWGAGSALFAGSVLPLLSVFGVTGDLGDACRDGVLVGLVLGVSGGLCRTLGGAVATGTPVNASESILLGAAFAIGFGAIFGFVAQWIQWFVGGTDVSGTASVAAGIGAGCAFAVAGVLTAFRLPSYPIEVFWQVLLYLIQRLFGYETLSLSPVMFHELAFLPYPTLSSHIRLTERTNFEVADDALQACRRSPGQMRLAKSLQAELLADKITSLIEQLRFDEAAHALANLAATSGIDVLDELAQAARDLSSLDVHISDRRAELLASATKRIERLDRCLQSNETPLGIELFGTLPIWRKTISKLSSNAS